MLRDLSYVRRIRELLSADGPVSAEASRIVDVIYTFVEEEGRVPEVRELLPELDLEEDRRRLTELVMAEEVIEDPQRMIRDCVERIRRQRLGDRCEELRTRIMELEREGRTVSRKLLQEYDELNRTLKGKPQ
jgi:hypothetical protein